MSESAALVLAEHLSHTVRLLRRDRSALARWVRPLLAGVKVVRLRPLGRGRKVLREGAVLWVDQDYCLRTYRAGDEESLAACTIYVVHELLHVGQGMAEKQTVLELRATGAEETLMRVDLAADHAAARLSARVFPRLGLLGLKELQGRALAAFPVGPAHTRGARRRKCRRLSALRMDVQARRAGIVADAQGQGGPLWLEFAPQGGILLIMQEAPLPRVCATAVLDAAEARMLDSAADPKRGVTLERLDALCQNLLARAEIPAQR